MILHRCDERGWALVSVLLVIASLSLLAAAAQNLSATGLRAERIAWDRTRLDAALDAGVTAAAVGLITNAGWPEDGSPRQVNFAGQQLRIAIQDERGRIDLNAADGSLLKDLFLSAGVQDQAANAIVAKIVDWRTEAVMDGSGVTRANDVSAKVVYSPRHGPFQSVDELRLVAGVSNELYRKVAPALTIYSTLPAVDQSVAPKEVLDALNSAGQNLQPALFRGASPEKPIAGRTFSIEVATQLHGRRSERTATVLLTGDDANPYIVLAWR